MKSKNNKSILQLTRNIAKLFFIVEIVEINI